MHPIEWLTAQPLWNRALANGPAAPGADRFRSPALLRLEGDDFMQQVQARLAAAAPELSDLVARYETWREPGAGWLEPGDARLGQPVKLYQPAHGRYYLIAASLVCRTPGFPDRKIDAGAGETAAFVLRRLVPDPADPSTLREHGWVPGQGWRLATTPAAVLPGEERLPLFGITAERAKRRLLFGLVPAASRETFAAGPELSPIANPADDLGDPREHLLKERVTGAIRELVDLPFPLDDPIAVTASLFILLDFAELLQTHARTVWNALPSSTGPSATAKNALWFRLRNDVVGGTTKWASALVEVNDRRTEILDPGPGTTLPTFDLRRGFFNGVSLGNPATVDVAVAALLAAVVAAFDAAEPPAPPQSEVPAVPKLDPSAGSLYVARCVYERPVCAGIHPPAVSQPSQAFQLAPFFDPDAPVRPIRIQMPVDTSVKGLRKFPRAVSFLISDQLRKQMSRIEGIKLEQLDKGEVGGEGDFDLGMICSLSIPIITICALILLLVIVFVLNIVFWWIPFFRICLPLKLKAG